MHGPHRAILIAATLGGMAFPVAQASAQAGFEPSVGAFANPAEKLVQVRVLSDVAKVMPGQTFVLAFVFDIEPHWHIYWTNPGGGGAPTSIDVTGPEGFTFGPTRFTRPQKFGDADSLEGITYGYEDQAVLFVEVKAPERLASERPVAFSAEIMWLVCKEVCLMGQVTREITLDIAAPGTEASSSSAPIIERALKRLPRPFEDIDVATIEFADHRLSISMPAGEYHQAMFFPIDMPGVTFGEARIAVESGLVNATVPVEVRPHNALGQPLRIAGVLALGESPDDPCFFFELPLSDPSIGQK